jgi:hypothetical protein
MYARTALIILVLALSSMGISVYAGTTCSVNFKRARTHRLSTPVSGPLYIDMDGDGIKDLIGQTAAGVAFYKGSANGFVTAPVLSALTGNIASDERTDFNNDGKLDLLAYQSTAPGFIRIYLNNGSGGFTLSTETLTTPVNTAETIAGTADLNGDGRVDLVTTDGFQVLYRLRDDQNRFGEAVNITGANGIRNLFIRDVNGDGKTDLVYTVQVYNQAGGYTEWFVQTKINQGNTTFTTNSAPTNSNVFYYPRMISFADMTGDGRAELVTGIYWVYPTGENNFSVFQFDSAGAITATEVQANAILPPSQNGWLLRSKAGDFDGDGKADIIFDGYLSYSVFAKNNGSLNFTLQKVRPIEDTLAQVTEFNGDGKADLFSTNYWARGGDFSSSVSFRQNVCQVQGQTRFVDFDGNNTSDIAFWRPSDGRWMFYSGLSYGTYPELNWGLGSLGDIPVPQDYDGDGKSDHAVYRDSTGYWYILRSSDGQFSIVNFGLPGDKPVPADFDGDGAADIAIYRPSQGSWYILPSASPGTFSAMHWGLEGDVPLPLDYDGDGKADIAIWRQSNRFFYIYRSSDNQISTPFMNYSQFKPIPADYDNDGTIDLAGMAGSTPSATNWFIQTSQGLYTTELGMGGEVPFVITDNGAYVYPRIFRRSTSEVMISNSTFMSAPGQNNSRVVSWILPTE